MSELSSHVRLSLKCAKCESRFVDKRPIAIGTATDNSTQAALFIINVERHGWTVNSKNEVLCDVCSYVDKFHKTKTNDKTTTP